MVATENYQLPDDKELNVEEIKATYPVLHAASYYVGKKCELQNNEYMLCKVEERDPRRCLKEGRDVTNCAMEVFKKLKKHCKEDFEQYVHCLEQSSPDLHYKHCRKTQAVIDKCVLDNLQIERPHFGYFCEAKIHDSPRPRPAPKRHEFPDALPPLPTEKPEHRAVYGSRMPGAS